MIFFRFRIFGFCHLLDQDREDNVQTLMILSFPRIRNWGIRNGTSKSRLPVAFLVKTTDFEILRFLELDRAIPNPRDKTICPWGSSLGFDSEANGTSESRLRMAFWIKIDGFETSIPNPRDKTICPWGSSLGFDPKLLLRQNFRVFTLKLIEMLIFWKKMIKFLKFDFD